jgi:hypothetical protein
MVSSLCFGKTSSGIAGVEAVGAIALGLKPPVVIPGDA